MSQPQSPDGGFGLPDEGFGPPGQGFGPPPGEQPAYAPAAGYQAYPPPTGQPIGSSPQPQYAGYAAPAPGLPTSTVVLLVVSVLCLLATGIIGIPSAIIAALAWRRGRTDPTAARRRTTTGWVVFGVNFALAVPLLIWFYAWALRNQ